MSQLTELISKTIHDIQFNGCTLPETIIRMQIDNIVACAKLEESIERNNTYLESLQLDSAHGNGANDRPNVIGDMITEPSLTPEQMVKGVWYVTFLTNDHYWLFEFDSIKNGYVYTNKTICLGNSRYFNLNGTLSFVNDFTQLRPATKEEVLKYFPDENFGEPADYVNPITN